MTAKRDVKAGDVFESDVALDTQDPSARVFFEKEHAKALAIGTRLAALETEHPD